MPVKHIHVVEIAFKATWFDKWNWLHYDEAADAAFFHVLHDYIPTWKAEGSVEDLPFIQRGFSNWKDATEGF